jgi:phage antirepressor YoqD-like protein
MKRFKGAYIYGFIDLKTSEFVYIGKHNGTNKSYFTGSLILRRKKKKHGKTEFDSLYRKEILKQGEYTEDELNNLECHFIKHHNTYYKSGDFGFNFTLGGEGVSGLTHSAETRRKVSEAQFQHLTENQKKSVLKKYQDRSKKNMTIRELASKLNIGHLAIRRFLREEGVLLSKPEAQKLAIEVSKKRNTFKVQNREISKKQKMFIIKRYLDESINNLTVTEIVKKTKRNWTWSR